MNNGSKTLAQAYQLESQFRSDRVHIALKLKAQRGEYPGKPPVGYLNNSSTKQIIPDPKSWEIIKQALTRYATGNYTVGWITHFLNTNLPMVKNGDRHHFTRSQVISILQNRFYVGEFIYRGEVYQGKHKPMIARADFEKNQKILKGGKM